MTAERNTIYDLVSDLEMDICNMEGYASLLQLAADGVAQHHSEEAGDGLIRLATETSACVRRLREWHRIAHAAVGGQDDAEPVKPAEPPITVEELLAQVSDDTEPAKGFDAIFAEWNTNRKQQGEGAHEMSDEQAERLNEQESTLLDKIVATPVTSAGEIAAKVFVAKKLIEGGGSRWSDERDVKVLGSVMEDLTRLGAQGHQVPAHAPEPVKPAKPTIYDLCHQWDVVAAKLTVEVLERGHEQETIEHVTDPAEARWREIERAILDTDPDTIRDVDLVEMLRLARKVIGNDEYATSEAAAEAMLDLIETTLVRRTGPGDWGRAA